MLQTRTHSRLTILLLAALVCLGRASVSQAGERHYIIVFGAQSHPKLPRYTHTFATIIRVMDCPPGCTVPPVQTHTISWLPRTLVVHPFRCQDEPGVNLDLHSTLNWACQNRMRVSQWGPYAVDEEFFLRLDQQFLRIESGIYRYKAVDVLYRGTLTTDCIHAVSDLDRVDGRFYYDPIIRNGDKASRRFVRAMYNRGRFRDPVEDVSRLNTALGLDHYPIIHRPDP